MTPTTFKAIRKRSGLSARALAELFRIADGRTIRRYEAGDREVSGPVSLLMELLDAGKIDSTVAKEAEVG